MNNKLDENQEDKILDEIVDRAGKMEKSVWLRAGFGARERQLRELRKFTMQEVADRVGTSVATLSRLENGSSSSVQLDLLIGLGELYKVSIDFLVGRIRNPERTYYSLKDLGLTPRAGMALYRNKADQSTVNQLLENKRFQQLTNDIRDFVVCKDDGLSLIAEFSVNSRTADRETARRGNADLIVDYAEKLHAVSSGAKLASFGSEIKKTVQEMKERNSTNMKTLVNFTAEMLAMMKESSEIQPEKKDETGNNLTPERMSKRIFEIFSLNGKIKGDRRRFFRCLRDALISLDLDDSEETYSIER